MKVLLILLLAVACQAYTPIEEQSWVTFHKVNNPTYENWNIFAWGLTGAKNMYFFGPKVKNAICDGTTPPPAPQT